MLYICRVRVIWEIRIGNTAKVDKGINIQENSELLVLKEKKKGILNFVITFCISLFQICYNI